jgi:predicted RNA-binding Zn-ribbon protein involved in translation (DUF1610 family)
MLVQKVCPNCGQEQLMGYTARPCFLKVKRDTIVNKDIYELISEDTEPARIQYDIIKCANCGQKVKKDQLIVNTVKCNKCGTIVSAGYVNEQGICYTCLASEQIPNIANASKEDLLMMLIKNKTSNTPVQEVQTNPVEQTKQAADNTETTEEKSEEAEETQKPRKRATRKKKTEEAQVEVPPTEEPTPEEFINEQEYAEGAPLEE